MIRNTLLAVAAFLACWGTGTLTPVSASEEGKNAYPHLIICDVAGVRHFGWLDRIEADGTAVYLTPSGKFGRVGKDGVVTVMGGQGANPGSCGGKTIDELIASGDAHYIGE